ncbi:unnamed protein product [Schistocephalus solidus]|uniref:Uncharacterized protein n=1 Tax=Schistocephalus solidus TaxID=70667 RepID=A0A183TL55_SCHSO|nr:unnamed protein product [Schistocephalus solidus]
MDSLVLQLTASMEDASNFVFPSDGFVAELRLLNEMDKPLKSEHLLELLRHHPNPYSTFGGQMYEKTQGSPLSGLIAEVVHQRIQHFVSKKCQPMF